MNQHLPTILVWREEYQGFDPLSSSTKENGTESHNLLCYKAVSSESHYRQNLRAQAERWNETMEVKFHWPGKNGYVAL